MRKEIKKTDIGSIFYSVGFRQNKELRSKKSLRLQDLFDSSHTKGKSRLERFQKIGLKLFTALFIPVALLLIYGLLSYQKSQHAIINNYEISTGNTVEAVSDYINYALIIVRQKSLEYQLSTELQQCFGYKKNDYVNILSSSRVLNEKIVVDTATNPFISELYMFGANEVGLGVDVDSDFYSSFIKSDLANKIDDSEDKFIWVGEHDEIDVLFSTTDKSHKNNYAMSAIRRMQNGKGYIIIDISTLKIQEMFAEYDIGEGSIIGLVTGDGREILGTSEEQSVFVNTDFYEKALREEIEAGHFYINLKDKEYLFLYQKLNDVNAAVCALVPKSTILSQVKEIKILNIIFVAFACVLTIIVGSIIGGGITRAFAGLEISIVKAAKGDLTTEFNTKRKDEFHILSKGIGNMLHGMKKLIGETLEVGSRVNISAKELSDSSTDLLNATKGISQVIDNIEKGIVQQAGDSEDCLLLMTGLSDQINYVYSNMYEMERIADSTKVIVSDGLETIDELSLKSKATTDITHSVIEKIEEFEIQSNSIKEFINIINDIASQTNLLSLNASIEAARAGERGRGFAIVAEEIRKLADQSINAAGQIQNLVQKIQIKTQDTVETALEAENIVRSQAVVLDATINTFHTINEQVRNLVHNLNDISSGIKRMEAAKEDTMKAIESISAVSEQTAAAAQEVSATAINQVDYVERMNLTAIGLEKEAKKLEEAIRVFKID